MACDLSDADIHSYPKEQQLLLLTIASNDNVPFPFLLHRDLWTWQQQPSCLPLPLPNSK